MLRVELKNEYLSVGLIDYGARIDSIWVKDSSGLLVNVVQGYAKPDDYLFDESVMGAVVGPIANRVSGGRVPIGGKEYWLPINEGRHSLHSGGVGFDRHYWKLLEQTEQSATFALDFDLSLMGLEGRLKAQTKYWLEGPELKQQIDLVGDTLTWVNPSSHLYLNLSGKAATIKDHRFTLYADSMICVNGEKIPTGEVYQLEPPVRYQLDKNLRGLTLGEHGLDHHFCVQDQDSFDEQACVSAHSQESGITLEILSNAPGFQFYTCEHLSKPFVSQGAFCVEPQTIPDAINNAKFKTELLPPNEHFERLISWRFLSGSLEG